MPTNGQDRTPLDAVFRETLHPRPVPPEADRGHFALLVGKLTAQETVLALVSQQLTIQQRDSLNAYLGRAIDLSELRLQEMERVEKDRESLAHVGGCIKGFRQARKRFI